MTKGTNKEPRRTPTMEFGNYFTIPTIDGPQKIPTGWLISREVRHLAHNLSMLTIKHPSVHRYEKVIVKMDSRKLRAFVERLWRGMNWKLKNDPSAYEFYMDAVRNP